MKEIKLTKGMVTLVDDEDFERLNQHKWHSYKNGKTYYARRWIRVDGKVTTIDMHREIMDAKKGKEVHHDDDCGLNNQRCNLKVISRSQHNLTMSKQPESSSRHKGVHWYKRYSKWQAYITIDYKHIHLGYFDTEQEAAKAYNKAAKKRYEFARLNVA